MSHVPKVGSPWCEFSYVDRQQPSPSPLWNHKLWLHCRPSNFDVFVLLQVSLLEYRNRSRNRLSVDLPRPLPPTTAPSTAPVSASVALFSSSVIKSAVSLPNLSVSPAPSTITHRPVSSVAEMNGPHLEPVSPDLEDKSGKMRASLKFIFRGKEKTKKGGDYRSPWETSSNLQFLWCNFQNQWQSTITVGFDC